MLSDTQLTCVLPSPTAFNVTAYIIAGSGAPAVSSAQLPLSYAPTVLVQRTWYATRGCGLQSLSGRAVPVCQPGDALRVELVSGATVDPTRWCWAQRTRAALPT